MSEYQYYEFQALDRTLTAKEQAALREISSRAKITPSSLTNDYQWGSFKGNPVELMKTYFDLHVYYANFGVKTLMLRLPKGAFDPAAAAPYLQEDFFEAKHGAYGTLLVFNLSPDDWGHWADDESGEGWAVRFAPLREELLAGDLRPLYLAWLAECSMTTPSHLREDDGMEPPVPAGLKSLTPAQVAFVEFFMIEEALLLAAAEASGSATASASPDWAKWLKDVPPKDKDGWLARLLSGERDAPLRAEIIGRRRAEEAAADGRAAGTSSPRRSCAELADAWERQRAELQRREKAAEAARKAAAAKKAAELREKRLEVLAAIGEADGWKEAESLATSGKAARYADAIRLLEDLLELAARDGRGPQAKARLQAFQAKHSTRTAFLKRLKEAGLG